MMDIAIIGGGPAGLSAAIQARMRELSVVLVAREDAKGALTRAPLIENYPGIANENGTQLLAKMKSHALALGTEFHDGKVTSVTDLGGSFGLAIGADFVQAKIVILATGARQPKMLPGEADLVGQGVSYCATCDGMLYRGKRVAVLAESAHAPAEANFLQEVAAGVLYFGKADPALHKDIQMVEGRIDSLVLQDGKFAGVTAGGQEYPLDGLFIERDQMALDSLIPGIETEGAFIRVDRNMRTSIPGIFAAGDCTGGVLQVSKAVGDGCVAAYIAAQDLATRP